MSLDQQKREAARAALDYVTPGMKLGLGTGSTAAHFVDLLGRRVAEGLDVVGVPTSDATRKLAEEVGVPLTTLGETPCLDLCIDGADEVDPALTLIKGGGGALTREKIVAQAANSMIVIADETKVVEQLGHFPLPVEVLAFGVEATLISIESCLVSNGMKASTRFRHLGDQRYVTDNGNWIVDCFCEAIPNTRLLANELLSIAGVVEQGLFLDLCDLAIFATDSGIDIRRKKDDP